MIGYRLCDLLDLPIVQKMADAHYRAAGMPIGIIDAIDGSILVGAGWQDICVKFHRANPLSLQRCRESDSYIKDHLVRGEACRYKCKNGLWDIGIPIVVAECHLATMFLGQFFYEGEVPDRKFFTRQAHEFGFNVNEYLAALDRVPVFSREKVDHILEYDQALADFIADLAGHALSKIEADEKIKRQADFLQVLIDAMPYPVFYKDRQGRYLGCNRSFERFYGISRERIAGKTVYEIAPKDLADVYRRTDDELWANPGMQTYEGCIQSVDGERHDVIFHKATFAGPDGSIAGLIGAAVDITERKRAENERAANLRFFESMDRVNRAMQGANDLEHAMSEVLEEMLSIFDCDRAWLLYPCDPEASSWRVPMERARPEYPGALAFGGEIPMDHEVSHHLQTALVAEGPVTFGPGCDRPLSGEVMERFRHRSQILMAVYPKVDKPWLLGMQQCSRPRVWTRDEKRLFQEIGRRLGDSLDSLLMYRDLRNSEAKIHSILDNISIGVALISPEMEILELNQTMRKWFPGIDPGQRPVCYQSFNDPPRREVCDYCPTCKTLQDGLVYEATTQTPRPEGTRNYRIVSSPIFDPDGRVTAAIEMVEDITEKLSLESRLRQAQKMESIGRLAGGVAHDFNNMLGVIIGHSELALELLDPQKSLYSSMQEIQKAAFRSADLTRQLLAFARKQTVAPKVLDLNETVEGMLKMLRRLIGENIDLVWLPAQDLWPVKMDPSQIDQILANLCVNARDAIANLGKITIETQRATFDEAYCANHSGFIRGDFVMLAVSDDGRGLDKETLEKIFEPFFTTKEMGKGTGLGLATVYGVVKQNNGFINVYSKPGQGTTFKIYLPRHAANGEQMRKERPGGPEAQGGETVLLVEDEAANLKITRLILERLGYRVLVASTSDEAFAVVKKHLGEIDLLLTDVVMPGMSGKDLAKGLASLCPGIRILFMSGYTGNVIARHGVLDKDVHFIQKPLSREGLAAKVREVLAG